MTLTAADAKEKKKPSGDTTTPLLNPILIQRNNSMMFIQLKSVWPFWNRRIKYFLLTHKSI
jgi:hypothetical protein